MTFCIKCAARLRPRGRLGTRECPRCGWVYWNNPSPTASVLILEGRRVLLARRAVAPLRGYWDVVGGFVEPGETADQAARREVREELGVDVRLERLLGILPGVYGPEKKPTLNIYYVGRLGKDAANVRPADDVESVAWFPLTDLPQRIAFKNNRAALRLLRALPRRGGP